MRAILLWLGGSIAAIFVVIRSFFLITVRLRMQHGVVLYSLIMKEGRKFVIQTEWYNDDFPKEMCTVCLIKGILMLYRSEERLLRAGFTGVDIVVRVTIFRWNLSRLVSILEEYSTSVKNEVPVFLAQSWEAEQIGRIKVPSHVEEPYLTHEKYKDIEKDIEEVLFKGTGKTGVILHGGPGNGKTFLVRYFAIRFKLPVYLITFKPDYDNHDIIRIFAHIKPPAIVLFEDFDSYFDKRKCKLPEAKFSFDIILNVLDGIFSARDGLVVCMTVNDIERVDGALKARPSRFKFVKQIDNPPYEVRKRILNDHKLAESTKGYSLDELLFFSDKRVKMK